MSRRPALILATCLILAGIVVLYGAVLAGLVRQWAADEDYSHGFLILPIAAYLAWERRGLLAAAPVRPSALGIVVLLGSMGILAAGTLGAELFLTRISLLGVVAGLVLFLAGWRHVRVLLFPIAFLLLMIPLPAIVFNQVAFPLQLLASRFGELTLSAAGIPVLREGNVITLANTTLQVAEACSGIRSLISLLTLAVVFGYFTERRTWARVALALASIPVAILANAFRVAGTGIAAHYYGPGAAEGFLHTFSGWLVFLVAFLLLLGVQRLLARVGGKSFPPSSAETPGTSTSSQLPTPRDAAAARPSPLLRALLVSACMVGGAVAIGHASQTEPTPSRQSFEQFPTVLGNWQGQGADRFDQQTLAVLGVDDYISRTYSAPGQPAVGLYIGFYRSQRQGDTIHSPLNCLPGAGWEPVHTNRVSLDVPADAAPSAGMRRIVVNQVVIQKGLDRQVVLYWYQSHGRVTASEYWGKILTVLDALRLNRTDAALVRVISPVAGNDPAGEAASEAALRSFVRTLFPVLTQYLPD